MSRGRDPDRLYGRAGGFYQFEESLDAAKRWADSAAHEYTLDAVVVDVTGDGRSGYFIALAPDPEIQRARREHRIVYTASPPQIGKHPRGQARQRVVGGELQPREESFVLSPTHFEAAEAWRSRRAYWDGSNYRVRASGSSRGPLAPWNRTVKRDIGGPEHLHAITEHLLGRARWREHLSRPRVSSRRSRRAWRRGR